MGCLKLTYQNSNNHLKVVYSNAFATENNAQCFFSVDPLAPKYTSWSPYTFCIDNPILNIDSDGREVIVTVTQRENQKPLIEIKVSGAVIDESSKKFMENYMKAHIKTFQSEVNDVYNKSFDEFEVKVMLDFRLVKSRSEITESDHVISIQDEYSATSGSNIGYSNSYNVVINFVDYSIIPAPLDL
ncbi:MAG: hypothetical protein HYU67_00445 [Flavobacteriia bacterium]|nr:hypothetical protein [Flavobacteriia bacterium]